MNYIEIFLIGGAAYNLIEYMWRGYSHWTMTVDGGICLVGIYLICTMSEMNFVYKVMCCSALITGVELISGIIINKVMHLNIWDYSALPLNFLGQICVPYTLLWTALCIPLVAVIDIISEFG